MSCLRLPTNFFDEPEQASTKGRLSKGSAPTVLPGDDDDNDNDDEEKEEQKDDASKSSAQKSELPPPAQEAVANTLPAGN